MRNKGENDKLNVFDEMGVYWAEIADQNQTSRQIQFIEHTLKEDGLVLDIACGTGRHLIPLSNEGYNIVGVDVSLRLLKIAKNRWRKASVVRADMRFLPFKPHAFAAAISMDTSFGYLTSEQEDFQSLKDLHLALSRNGVLIIDVFNRERLMQIYKISGKSSRLEYPTFFLLRKRTIIENGQKLHDSWVVCDKDDGQIRVFEHSARLYEFKQLQDLLEKAGFKLNSVYGDYEGQDFSSSSRRLIFVINKI